MKQRTYRITEAELAVLRLLWRRDAATIRERLGKESVGAAKQLMQKVPEGILEMVVTNAEEFARENGYERVSRKSLDRWRFISVTIRDMAPHCEASIRKKARAVVISSAASTP